MADIAITFSPAQTEKLVEVLIDIGKGLLIASLAMGIVDFNSTVIMIRGCLGGTLCVYSALLILKEV